MMVLDIVAGIRAVGRLIEGKIWHPRERIFQLLGDFLLLGFERRNLVLQPRDLGHQRLRRSFLVASLGRTDLLGGCIAAG
jgi:hypothetical protein